MVFRLWTDRVRDLCLLLTHLQPGNCQVSKEVVHELKFGDLAVMKI